MQRKNTLESHSLYLKVNSKHKKHKNLNIFINQSLIIQFSVCDYQSPLCPISYHWCVRQERGQEWLSQTLSCMLRGSARSGWSRLYFWNPLSLEWLSDFRCQWALVRYWPILGHMSALLWPTWAKELWSYFYLIILLLPTYVLWGFSPHSHGHTKAHTQVRAMFCLHRNTQMFHTSNFRPSHSFQIICCSCTNICVGVVRCLFPNAECEFGHMQWHPHACKIGSKNNCVREAAVSQVK